MDFNLIDIIGVLILSFAIIFVIAKLLGMNLKDRKILIKFISCVVLMCVGGFLNYSFKNSAFRVCTNYIIIIFSAFVFCKSVISSVLSSLFTIVLITLSDMFVGILFLSTVKVNMETVRTSTSYLFFSNVTVSIIMITIISIKQIYNAINNLIKGLNKKKELTGIIIFTLITVIGIILIYFYYIFVEQSYVKTYLNVSLIVIYILISCSFFYQTVKNIQHKNNLMEINERYNRLEIYSQFNESLVEQLRKQKHEFKNNLVTIRAMADSEHLVNYINSLIKDNTEMDITYISKFKSIDDDGLKGLLAYKVLKMKEKNINVSIHIENSIEKFNLNKLKCDDSKDLYNIMGIIIDNAVEATEITEDKLIVIQAYAEKNKVNFVISNTFNGSVDFNKIFSHGYSTKGSKRGYGLAILQDIVDKDKKININTEVEDNIFSQHIIIKIT